jgi:hypothetical protein
MIFIQYAVAAALGDGRPHLSITADNEDMVEGDRRVGIKVIEHRGVLIISF